MKFIFFKKSYIGMASFFIYEFWKSENMSYLNKEEFYRKEKKLCL